MLSICRRYIYQKKYLFMLYLFTVIIKAMFSYISVFLSGNFLDMLIRGGNKDSLVKYCIIVSIVGLSTLGFTIINGYIGTKIQTMQAYKFGRDIYEHMISVPFSYIRDQDMAYMSQRINTDTNACLSFFIDTYINMYVSVINMLVSLTLIFKIEWRVGGALAALSLAYCIIFLVFKKHVANATKNYKEKSALYFSEYYGSMEAITFAKSHGAKKIFLERLDKAFGGLFQGVLSYQKVLFGMTGADGALSTLANIFIYFIGGIAIIKGNVTVGLFSIILNLFGSMVSSIKFFLNYGNIYQETKVSYDRLVSILKLKSEINGEIELRDISTIRMEDVSFGYDKNVIDHFTYEFKKGQIYYIIGKNGVGKTTFLNLLLGHYRDEMEGRIFFDDVDICDIDMNKARNSIVGYSEQETYLLQSSIYDNLTMFQKDYIKLNYYLNSFGLCNSEDGRFIEKQVNTYANNLSGGEKQKISIIRQLLQNPKVLIFDEPTANLESDGKETFINILDSIKDDKIIIVVSHDNTLLDGKCNIVKFE